MLELTFGFFWEAAGLKDRVRETAEEVLLVFTGRLELTLGGFLAETTGELADLVGTELLRLETAGAR